MTDRERRGALVRSLGEQAVAQGWRRKLSEQVAPRAADRAPVSSGEVHAALGLLFLAMSGTYLLRSLLAALRHPDVGQRPSSLLHAGTPQRLRAVPFAGASTGWRKTVADRVTPKLAARTPLEEHQARAVVGAGFLALSTYYVANSLRKVVRKPLRSPDT